jgi:ABC-type enterochelin transport system permease subunit
MVRRYEATLTARTKNILTMPVPGLIVANSVGAVDTHIHSEFDFVQRI